MIGDRNPAGRTILTLLAAIVIVVLVVGSYVYLNEKPPVHSGNVLSVSVYPIHRELAASNVGGSGGTETYDELIVLANVEIDNRTDIPLFLQDMYADVQLSGDESQRSSAAGQADFQKVFIAYSQLAPQRQAPLLRDLTLQPGQHVQGQVIFHYPISKQQWDARTGLTLVFEFRHQKNLILKVPNGPAHH